LKASIIILSLVDSDLIAQSFVLEAETAMCAIEPVADYLEMAAKRYAGEIKKLCDKSSVASTISIEMGHPVEIFYTLKEAKTLIEKWRMEYNTFRPHSSLNYRPPAPEAYLN
jgi:transposase InsO family protein